MTKRITIEQAVTEFREEAAPLVATCEWGKLRQIFANWTARARASNPEDEFEAVSAMRGTLRELLYAPSRKVKQGFFDDF